MTHYPWTNLRRPHAETKLTRFRDAPKFTRSGHWECNFRLDEAVLFVERQRADGLAVDIDPDFQRGHVWTEAQQVAWLEFVIRGGITSRVLYFNHPGWMGDWKGTLVLVDGKQRLEAIRRLVGNEIKVFGSYFREFTDPLFMPDIRINVNDLKTRAEVLQWYIDFNTGGVVHADAEIARVRDLLEKETAVIR